jgi:hypothetical protein
MPLSSSYATTRTANGTMDAIRITPPGTGRRYVQRLGIGERLAHRTQAPHYTLRARSALCSPCRQMGRIHREMPLPPVPWTRLPRLPPTPPAHAHPGPPPSS